MRRSEAHALVAAKRSHEADRLRFYRGLRDGDRAAPTRSLGTCHWRGELARPVAALPSPSPRKSRQSARGAWAVSAETIIEDTTGSRDFRDSGDDSGDAPGDDPSVPRTTSIPSPRWRSSRRTAGLGGRCESFGWEAARTSSQSRRTGEPAVLVSCTARRHPRGAVMRTI